MKKIYPSFLLALILILPLSFSFAQQKPLPRNLTEAEKGLVTHFQFRQNRVTPPPTVPVRASAEWEEVEYLLVTWESNYQNILRQVVAAAVNECKVIITTQNPSSVSSYLTAGGVSLTNVTFLNVPWDSIWIRDYAGNTIYENEVGDRALIDWIYNRPRPNDDVMPVAHAAETGLQLYTTNSGTNDLVNTGGNYMSDGLGNAFASELILNENAPGNPYGVSAKSEAQIDGIMQEYMGINRFVKMQTLPFDGIHHIDMHMKLLDEQTILVSQYPEGVADGPQIEENIQYIEDNFQSPFGEPYRIKWLAAPPSTGGNYPDTGGWYRTYTNAVFVNKTILVPTYRPETDGPALAYWQELMPGYNIVGIDVDNPDEPLIAALGAIHCITHVIGVADPLWIVHQPIEDGSAGASVTVDAMIKHNSGINNATVLWREEGATDFSETAMSNVGDDNWSTNLILPTNGNNVEYYIAAEANSGKSMTRPIVAPNGYYTIQTGTLSIDEFAENHISSPYPNPTTGNVSLKLDNIAGPIQISIYNLLGQQLYRTSVENGNGIIDLELNSTWNGILFISLEGDFGKVVKKVIKL